MSLNMRLKHYQSYLDDHDAFRQRRSKWIAMKKYCLIMRSIKIKSRNLFQFEYHEEDEEEDIDEEEVEVDDNDDDDEHDKIVGFEQTFDDPFERDQRTTSTSMFMGIGQSRRTPPSSSSSSGCRFKGKCNVDDYNRILRRHRARIVKETNQYNLAWDTAATTDPQLAPNQHYSNDISLGSSNIL